tara:strand:+ start:1867 stop:2436 length:570 start_codon:yes stop_codon:yes gene_type:complete
MALPAVAIGVGTGLLAAAPHLAEYFSKGQKAMRKDLAARVDSWKAGNKMVSDAERQDWMNTLVRSLPRDHQFQRVGRTTSGADTAALVGRSKDTDELRAKMFGTLIDKYKQDASQREKQLKADIKTQAAENKELVAGLTGAVEKGALSSSIAQGDIDMSVFDSLGEVDDPDAMKEILQYAAMMAKAGGA